MGHFGSQDLVQSVRNFQWSRYYRQPEFGSVRYVVSAMVLAAGSGQERKFARAERTSAVCQLSANRRRLQYVRESDKRNGADCERFPAQSPARIGITRRPHDLHAIRKLVWTGFRIPASRNKLEPCGNASVLGPVHRAPPDTKTLSTEADPRSRNRAVLHWGANRVRNHGRES
jgi:hypothetical protein